MCDIIMCCVIIIIMCGNCSEMDMHFTVAHKVKAVFLYRCHGYNFKLIVNINNNW